MLKLLRVRERAERPISGLGILDSVFSGWPRVLEFKRPYGRKPFFDVDKPLIDSLKRRDNRVREFTARKSAFFNVYLQVPNYLSEFGHATPP